MRAELGQAQDKVREMQHGLRTTERNLDVSRLDQQEMNKSLSCHICQQDRLTSRSHKKYQTNKG
jgi:hypothetical protein